LTVPFGQSGNRGDQWADEQDNHAERDTPDAGDLS
jgi:hypothetical protein